MYLSVSFYGFVWSQNLKFLKTRSGDYYAFNYSIKRSNNIIVYFYRALPTSFIAG